MSAHNTGRRLAETELSAWTRTREPGSPLLVSRSERHTQEEGQGIPDKSMIFLKCNISKIESGAFEDLDDFSSITLSIVKISDGDSGAFSKIGKVVFFAIDQLSIQVIRSAMFIDFTNVTKLYIAGSTFDIIENEAFFKFQLYNVVFIRKLSCWHHGKSLSGTKRLASCRY